MGTSYRPGTTRPAAVAMLSGEEPKPEPRNPGLMGDGESDAAPTKPQGLGPWLDLPEPEVAKDIDEQWNAQNRSMRNRFARWELNERRIEGDTFSKLVQDTDQDSFRVYTPENAELAPPSLNKTRDLSNKMVANLLVDPPKFEAEPPSDTDEDIDASEFATRALENEAGETGLDLVGALEEASDLACIYGSAFIRYYVDPNGGGRKPKEILASIAAKTVDDALFVTQPPVEAVDGTAPPAPTKLPQPGPFVLRYVMPDGQLTDDPSQADLEWLPKIRREVLTGKHVRFLPETASGIDDAHGVLIAAYTTLGQLKRRFEKVAQLSDEDQQKIVAYRPPDTKKLLPLWAGDGKGTRKSDGKPGIPDDAQVLTITGYLTSTPEYPNGAYVCMAGGKLILERIPWEASMTTTQPANPVATPETDADPAKKKMPLALDIPVAQVRQFRDAKGHDPYGRGAVDVVGDGDPIRSFLLGSVIEYLHRVNNPHIFVPVGAVHENYVGLPRGTPIPYNASAGGVPKYEEFAALAPQFMEMFQEIGIEQNSSLGLQETAQGLESATAQSGIAKQIVVEQALVALGKPKRGLDKAGIRSCRIILQLMRQAYTKPTRIRITGEDGAYKEQEFSEADLGSTVDARIMVGTSTMLPASAKQALIMQYATPVDPNQPPIISIAEAKKLVRSGVRSLIGMQDSKPLLRIKGQVKRFKDGPQENWAPAAPPVDPTTGQPLVDAATGQPVPPPPDPANPFADQRPSDDVPENAQTRFAELTDLLDSSAYLKHDAKGPWSQYAFAEWMRAKTAAGVMTIPEQQAAQAQAAQQQADAQAQEADKGRAAKSEDQQNAQASENDQRDAERAHATELEAMKQQGAAHREAVKASATTVR